MIPLPSEKVITCFFLLSTVTFAGNFIEHPFFPDRPYPLAAWLYNANDGFGRNYGIDEDNLRTFGVNAGAVYKDRFMLSCDFSALTDRNTIDSLSLRIDEIKPMAGYRFVRAKNSSIDFKVFGGVGGIFYGDFSSARIQGGAHGMGGGLTRPFPHAYDESSAHGLAFIYSEMFLPKPSLNISLYGHVTHTLDYNNAVAVGYWMLKPMMQIKYRLAYEMDRVDKAGSAAHTIYEAENGFLFSTKVMVGPLVIERGLNLDNLNQFSYVGFRFNGLDPISDRETGYRITYSLGWPIGHNSWIETFRLHPFNPVPRLSVFLRTYHTENVFFNNITQADDDRRIRRVNETSIGTELYAANPENYSVINGFLFCGAGFDREMISTYDVYESRFLEMHTVPMVHAGAGVRVDVPDLLYKKKGRYVGAEIMINVRYGFKDTNIYTNPDLLLSWGLVFSER